MPAERVTRWLAEWKKERVWCALKENGSDATGLFDLDVSIFGHQMWLERVVKVIQSGEHVELPPMSDQHCQLGRWLKGVGKARYGSHSGFAFIQPKHRQLHELAAELIATIDARGREQAIRRLHELKDLSLELVTLLTALARKEVGG